MKKIRLLKALRDNPVLTWDGTHRAALRNAAIIPQPIQQQLPVWIGVGGTPKSFARAGTLGLPLSTGFFTHPEQFARNIDLYRHTAQQAGHDPATLRISAGSHLFVRPTSQGTRDDFYPHYAAYWAQNTPNAGTVFPRATFDDWVGGGMVVVSRQEVIDKILTAR